MNLRLSLFQAHKAEYNSICKAEDENNASAFENLPAERKKEIEDAILKFFVKERLPLFKLNSEYFSKLINGE